MLEEPRPRRTTNVRYGRRIQVHFSMWKYILMKDASIWHFCARVLLLIGSTRIHTSLPEGLQISRIQRSLDRSFVEASCSILCIKRYSNTKESSVQLCLHFRSPSLKKISNQCTYPPFPLSIHKCFAIATTVKIKNSIFSPEMVQHCRCFYHSTSLI